MIECASSFIIKALALFFLALYASVSSLEPVRRHFLSAFRLSRLAALISSWNQGTSGVVRITFVRNGACLSKAWAKVML